MLTRQQGDAYARDGNLAQAYLLFLRYSTLALDYIPKHPQAKTPDGRKAVKNLKSQLIPVLDVLDKLKPRLNAAHEEWVKVHANQLDAHKALEGVKSPYEKMAARDPALSWNPAVRAKILDAGENQDLAVNLAKQEIRRRDAARRTTRQAGISEEEEQVRRGAGLWDDWDASASRDQRDDGDDMRRNMDAVRRRLDQSEQSGRAPDMEGYTPNNYSYYDRRSSYQYPSISRASTARYDSSSSRPNDRYDRSSVPPPARPPKEPSFRLDYGAGAAPPRPNKEPMLPPYESTTPTEYRPQPPNIPAKTEKKERFTFRPAAYLENNTPIRPIFLPAGLREEFLRVAAPNTRRGLEMCGILCGTSVNNALFISCLIIPQQTCTSDTCETDNEESVIEYCMREELMVFGWIHTHPTQTCFMSSRDLHTQSGYQIMMPESIAIVCAPRSSPS